MTSFVSHSFHMFSHLKFSRFLTFCFTYLHHWRSLTETPKDQVVEHTGSPEVTGSHHSDHHEIHHRDSRQHDRMVAFYPPVDGLSWFIHVYSIYRVSTCFNYPFGAAGFRNHQHQQWNWGTVSVIFSHFFFVCAQEADPFLGEHRNGVGDLKRVSYATIWLWLTVRHGKIHPFLMGKPSISMGHLYHGELLVMTGWVSGWTHPDGGHSIRMGKWLRNMTLPGFPSMVYLHWPQFLGPKPCRSFGDIPYICIHTHRIHVWYIY